MSLLDGKYEILREYPSGTGQSVFEASAPDGTLLRIVWFDVSEDQERSFEQYRRGLRRLLKAGIAAVFDVVSRPGAHYVAWLPPQGSRVHNPDPELLAALQEAGFDAAQAKFRRNGRKVQLYSLDWLGARLNDPAPMTASEPAVTEAAASRRSTSVRQSVISNGLAFVILLLAAATLVTAFIQRSEAATVTVTDVTGLDVNTALQQLAATGLLADPQAASSDEPAGTVLNVVPGPGQQLPRGSTVQLEYAFPTGEVRPVTVPGLIGLDWPAGVERQLASTQFDGVGVSWLASAEPAGTVLAQSEQPGSAVAEGTPLNLLVSSGDPVPTTSLPDLSGLELEEALAEALRAGLEEAQLSIVQVTDISARPGTVVGQLPEPDLEFVLEDAGITLQVARGDPEMEPLPDLTGLSLEGARALLSGFTLTVTEVSDTSVPAGIVSQSPEAGSWVDSGMLELIVNVHPQVIPVPRPEIDVLTPEQRGVAYSWFIEPGISEVTARVYATSLTGQEQLVAQFQVQGGEWVEGTFDTSQPLVTFRLTLNGSPYGETQRAR